MPENTPISTLPIPLRTDLIDGPGAFRSLANRLEQITVTPYATAAARTSAYTAAAKTPIEGTLSYLQDVNAFEYWDGAAWSRLLPDNTPLGIVKFVQASATFPASDYVAVNTERIVTDTQLTFTATAARVYRMQAHAVVIDGGPGSSTSSRGGSLRVRILSGTTTPTTTNTTIVAEGRSSTFSDDNLTSSSAFASNYWTCPASGTYTLVTGLHSYNTAGVRMAGARSLAVEDLGRQKT